VITIPAPQPALLAGPGHGNAERLFGLA